MTPRITLITGSSGILYFRDGGMRYLRYVSERSTSAGGIDYTLPTTDNSHTGLNGLKGHRDMLR